MEQHARKTTPPETQEPKVQLAPHQTLEIPPSFEPSSRRALTTQDVIRRRWLASLEFVPLPFLFFFPPSLSPPLFHSLSPLPLSLPSLSLFLSLALPPFPLPSLSLSRPSPSSLLSAMRARAYVRLPPFHVARLWYPSLVLCHLTFLPAPPACAEQRSGRHPFAGFAREWTTLGVGGRCATGACALQRLNRVVGGSYSARLLACEQPTKVG
jgi:hypothetical protein